MMNPDYTYHLPQERIALHPLPERDASKLLVADAHLRTIEHHHFRDVAELLPKHSTLVVNTTRVIAARLIMRKPTGGEVEVLLSKPLVPSTDPAVALQATTSSIWECIIGGRNVHAGMELQHGGVALRAVVLEKNGQEANVRLEWSSAEPLATVIREAGTIPLPPYIHRAVASDDAERYQTVYAAEEGSIAAPTAGLHMTDAVLSELARNDISRVEVVLHVGLGTFTPMHGDVREHDMHSERFGITRASLRSLIDACASPNAWITAVGTTSLRTLESLAIMGAMLDEQPHVFDDADVLIPQWGAFDVSLDRVDRHQAFTNVAAWMDERDRSMLWGETKVILAPGATIKTADALITNFHQPGTTLILLVAAFVGGEFWRNIYDAALENNYRFLSYGDSSLLFRSGRRSP